MLSFQIDLKGVSFNRRSREELFSTFEVIGGWDARLFTAACEAYGSVDKDTIELVSKSVRRIKKLPPLKSNAIVGMGLGILQRDVSHQDPEIYHGRDARWLYLARKADMVGLKQRNRLWYIVTSRTIVNTQDFKDYIIDRKIPFDAFHIDTAPGEGYARGIRAVLQLLKTGGAQLTKEEFEERARFQSASSLSRRVQLFPEVDSHNFFKLVVSIMEDSLAGAPPYIFRRFPNGKTEVDFNPGILLKPYSLELESWAMDQAITRHFLPKSSAV